METLKKIAVGIIGVLILWGMGYVLIQASHEPAGSLSPRQPAPAERVEPVPPESGEQPAPPVSRREPSSPPEMVPPSTAPSDGTPQPPGDTIAWRRAPSPKAPAGNGDAPVLSGKMPTYGNPNPIFIRAANRILPAVVTVHSTRRVRHPSINFFSPFFWKKDKDQEDEGEEDEQDFFQPGTGSGIIISKDGYIMTNHHVIENAQDVRVTLYDKREYTARIIGSDPTTDVGLLKIDIGGDTIPVAYIGNSDSIQIGEWVIAVGNPLNFNSTVTTGIISALGRSIDIIDRRYRYRIENFIQTDAVINPGNSGGALVNLNGEVIGINTAIATRNGFYQGYGFAIPINLARKVVSDLIKYGRVRRALLGVSIENVSDRVARAVGLPRPTGALVQGVSPGFPAEEVGLRQGDIILSVNGEEVVSVSDLQTKIARHQPGDVVTLVIWRDRRK
ncbi:MAG: PDZ domain-containing protein, partial [Calditrichaeota bacterium]